MAPIASIIARQYNLIEANFVHEVNSNVPSHIKVDYSDNFNSFEPQTSIIELYHWRRNFSFIGGANGRCADVGSADEARGARTSAMLEEKDLNVIRDIYSIKLFI